jgi:hypothetical protein
LSFDYFWARLLFVNRQMEDLVLESEQCHCSTDQNEEQHESKCDEKLGAALFGGIQSQRLAAFGAFRVWRKGNLFARVRKTAADFIFADAKLGFHSDPPIIPVNRFEVRKIFRRATKFDLWHKRWAH